MTFKIFIFSIFPWIPGKDGFSKQKFGDLYRVERVSEGKTFTANCSLGF